MTRAKAEVVVPVVVLAVGVGWLMNSLDIIPGVNWAWSIGIGAAGLLSLIAGGINKGTVVIGPLLLVGAVLSVARQKGYLPVNVEMPLLFIILGVLLLLSRLSNLPTGFERDKREPGRPLSGRPGRQS